MADYATLSLKLESSHCCVFCMFNRAAIEYEKKTHANNLEQGEAMRKNMMAMSREVEKLRDEHANAEKRARAAAAAAAANPSTHLK